MSSSSVDRGWFGAKTNVDHLSRSPGENALESPAMTQFVATFRVNQ
jgi:hypothetical protein